MLQPGDFVMRRAVVAMVLPGLLLLGVGLAPSAQADVVSGGALTAGQSVTGTTTVANRDIEYTFTGAVGVHLTFAVSATNWGTNGGAALRFYRPNTTGFDYCIITTAPKFCEITPDAAGTWKLRLDPGDNAVGSATFRYLADQARVALTAGTPVTTTIGTAGQNAGYSLTAVKDVPVALNISAASWGTGSALLLIFPPAGTPLYSHCWVTAGSTCEFTPNAAGSWLLTLDPQETTVGSTKLSLVGDQAPVTLTAGTPVTTTISTPGQNASYRFTGVNGTHVSFTVSAAGWGSGGTARFLLVRPDGTTADYCILGSGPAYCDVTADAAGTWSVLLDPTGGSVGSTTFTYRPDLDQGALIHQGYVVTTIGTVGQNANFTLAGVAGQIERVTMPAVNLGGGDARIYVFPPSGAPLFTHCDVVEGRICEFTPNVTGTWRVQLDLLGATVGTVGVGRI
jgi:hypothetical protein